MKYKKTFEPKSLLEVWESKESVYNDIKNMNSNEKLSYFDEGLEEAKKILNCKIKKNNDGSISLIPVK
ncbi:hypothetical protein JXI42_06510 [bacterium]|nr:hypothetical protein [bacterium]